MNMLHFSDSNGIFKFWFFLPLPIFLSFTHWYSSLKYQKLLNETPYKYIVFPNRITKNNSLWSRLLPAQWSFSYIIVTDTYKTTTSATFILLSICNLRVLLDKPPDIETPLVWGQFFFGCIIISTYSGGLHKLKSLALGACTVPWDAKQVLELK